MANERIERRIYRLPDQAETAADQGDWEKVTEYARMVLAPMEVCAKIGLSS